MQNPLQDYLSQIPFSADELNLMFPLIKPLNLNKGEFFVTPETVGPKICFIQKGMLRNYIKINNKEFTYHFAVESTSVGAMSIFIESYQSIEYIQAVEDCELLVANYPDIVNLFQQNINWANLGRLIGEKNYIEVSEIMRCTKNLLTS